MALSLAEAETVRRILHMRKKHHSQELIPNCRTEVALRYSPMCGPEAAAAGDGGVVFDASWGWLRNGSLASDYESAVAHNSFRFYDCDMHYTDAALNILIRTLRGAPGERERFFLSTIGVRRRMERKWQECPLAKVLTVADSWVALKQRAQV